MTWSFKGISSLAALACCLLSGRSLHAQTALPPSWLPTQVNENGQHCVPAAEQRQGDKLLVACGMSGVWEISLASASPSFVRSYAFSGEAIGFITEPDGRLWVKLHVLEARPLSGPSTQSAAVFPDVASSTPAPSPEPAKVATAAPPASAPARKAIGRVERAAAGDVVISLGTTDGISRGDHIEFALAEDGYDVGLSSDVIAVGVVANVNSHSARVRLGMNESVPVGALASPTLGLATGSLSAPPRVSGLWELELMARPFAAMDELGGGVLLSGGFGYRFSHWHLQAVLDPFAFAAVQTKGSVAAVNAAAIGSYDAQYFELGFGLGLQTMNETSFTVPPGSGMTAVQLIRLGARDGLNFAARTSIALFHSQFQFGSMVASAQIPLTRGYWLLLDGGGGNVGYGFGEMGLRALLAGNGLAGSKYLTVTAGGVGVFKSGTCDEFFSCSEEKSFGGPMVGVGGEWRF